jgi:metallophosphoesterase (TIGR00282 family)
VENSAGGFGLTDKVYNEIAGYGVDAFTGGNHIWDKPMGQHERLAVPANLSKAGENPVVMLDFCGVNVAILNLSGKVFMPGNPEHPFTLFDTLYEQIPAKSLVLVDFHAEATSEKGAFVWHVAGRAHAVFGTHTHIQTADEQVIDGKTFFITDAGSCGSVNSVLGMTVESSLDRLSGKSSKMNVEIKAPYMLNAVRVQFDKDSFEVVEFERIRKVYN